MTTGTMPTTKITAEEMATVARDASMKKPTTGYTPEMLEYRTEVENDFAAFKAKVPGAYMWIPCDLEGI